MIAVACRIHCSLGRKRIQLGYDPTTRGGGVGQRGAASARDETLALALDIKRGGAGANGVYSRPKSYRARRVG